MSMVISGTHRRLVLTGGGLAAFLAVAHAVVDAVTGMFAALLPTLQARFGPGETALAGLVAALALGTSVSQPAFGALADRPDSAGASSPGSMSPSASRS